MSTYLSLCQDVRRECGIAGTGPAAVTGQTGNLAKVVAWVASAWRDIQRLHPNWMWMRSPFTVNTVASTDRYAYTSCTDTRASATISRFNRWWAHDRNDPFKCYLTSGGVGQEYRLIWLPWDEFKWLYKFGAQQAMTGQPIHVSVDEDRRIVLGPNPNDIYTVSGDYQRGVQVLSADDDQPDLPLDYHDLITYYTMKKYGADSIAAEVYTRASNEADRILSDLELNQLPECKLAEPLA